MGSCGFFPFFMNLFYSTHSLFLRVIMFVLDFDVMDGAEKGIILNIRKCRAVIIIPVSITVGIKNTLPPTAIGRGTFNSFASINALLRAGMKLE